MAECSSKCKITENDYIKTEMEMTQENQGFYKFNVMINKVLLFF